MEMCRRVAMRVALQRSVFGRANILLLLACLGLLAGGVAVVGAKRFMDSPTGFHGPAVRLVVEPGMGLKSIARKLQSSGVIRWSWAFVLLARWRGQGDRLQAGVYQITPDLTPERIVQMLARGESLQDTVRFIEGWTLRQARAALNAHPGLRHDTQDWSDAALLEGLGAVERHPEGLLFPDTYRFAVGSSDLVVLRKAHQKLREQLAFHWERRDPALPLTSAYELLILASVVEKETGSAADRPLVASVFANRLRRGMRLQSDPTVIYGLGDRFDGNLRRVDLEADTPYNSYTRAGLPPTPIALVGEAALAAASQPARSDALYFVGRGDGSSVFSPSLLQHERAVDRYQRRR
jgi:UPF0755 protein